MKLNVKTNHENLVKNIGKLGRANTQSKGTKEAIIKHGQALTKQVKNWNKKDANEVCAYANELIKLRRDYQKKYGEYLSITNDKVGLDYSTIPSNPIPVKYDPYKVFAIDDNGMFLIAASDEQNVMVKPESYIKEHFKEYKYED